MRHARFTAMILSFIAITQIGMPMAHAKKKTKIQERIQEESKHEEKYERKVSESRQKQEESTGSLWPNQLRQPTVFSPTPSDAPTPALSPPMRRQTVWHVGKAHTRVSFPQLTTTNPQFRV